jgi:hypothetical protein
VNDVEQMTGRTLEGGPTVAGRNANRQDAEFAFGVKKFGAEQQQHNATLGVNRLNAFVRSMQPGTVIPKQIAEEAGMPDITGQPIRKNERGEKTITDKERAKFIAS